MERHRHRLVNLYRIFGHRSDIRDRLEWDQEAGEIVAWPEPFREVELECTRGGVSIGSRREVEQAFEEVVVMRPGSVSLQKPPSRIVSIEWLDRPVPWSWSPGYSEIEVEGEEWTLARIKYVARGWRWKISPGDIDLALFLLVDPNGGVEVEVIRGEEILGEEDIDDPLITTLPVAISRGRAHIEETAQPRIRHVVRMGSWHPFMPGERVELPDGSKGWITAIELSLTKHDLARTTLEVMTHAA